MIKKQTVKGDSVMRLRFELPKDFEADSLELLASFNNWQSVAFEKKRGVWKLSQDVPLGQTHEFRYHGVKGGTEFYWNDDAAEGTVANDWGTENAVIHT